MNVTPTERPVDKRVVLSASAVFAIRAGFVD
jgi:hypothetical protein